MSRCFERAVPMDPAKIKALLDEVAGGAVAPDEAFARLRHLPFEDVGGYARVDHHRPLRNGMPETIYCEGKTTEQVVGIFERLAARGGNVLGTRCRPETGEAVLAAFPEAEYHRSARTVRILRNPPTILAGYVAVVCAGTSDLPVADEAAVTLECLGSPVERITDVGVAGIHRLLAARDTLCDATALVVCAGMEGALPSAVAGLVDRPIIAVPTSVGYGANFGGIAALLGMLNSCGAGVSVVNIDNGFGAAVMAAMIHRLAAGVA